MRILLDHLYQNLVAPLVQDLCFRFLLITCISLFWISFRPPVSSLRSTCARSLFQDPFRPLLWRSCKTTCRRSLYEDPIRPLVQDLCFRILILLDHWYQDPVVARVQDLCLRISVWDSLWTACIRILQDHLYKIPVARSFGPLYQDTCARSLFQDPVGSLLSGSCRTTSARSLSQDLCVRILYFWATCIRIL